MSFLTKCWQILKLIGVRFVRDRLTYAASALTFTTLLALVPLAAVSLVILSALPYFKTLGNQIQQFVIQNFIPASGEIIQQYLQGFIKQAGNMSIVGVVFLAVTVIMMMLTIERAFNDVWKIERRPIALGSLVRYWMVLCLAPILVGLSIAATSYITSIPFVVGTAKELGMHSILLHSIPIILTVIACGLLYIVVPNCSVPIRYGLVGAVIATILFELAKKAFVFYLTHFPTYRLIYGTFAAIPIFLIWVYLSWVILLFGALVTNVLTMHDYLGLGEGIDPFTHTFLWLGCLWQAQQEGKGLTLKELFHDAPGQFRTSSPKIIKALIESGMVQVIQHDRYFLSRDLSRMTLAELYQLIPWKLPLEEHSEYLPEKMREIVLRANSALDDSLQATLGELYGELYK